MKCAKVPCLARQMSVFLESASDSCGWHLVAYGNAGRHKDLYWFGPPGGIILYVQFVLLLYLALVCRRGLQTVERDGRPKSLGSLGRKRVHDSCLVRAVAGENCPEFRCLFPSSESMLVCSGGGIRRERESLVFAPSPSCWSSWVRLTLPSPPSTSQPCPSHPVACGAG